MIISDYHIHSSFSADSNTPMEEMIETAIRLGLKHICFTDHMDYDFPKQYQLDFTFSIETYFDRLKKLQTKYSKQISVYTGIELGLKSNIGERLYHLVEQYPFDFVIASSHLVDNIDPYYPDFWETYSEEEGVEKYFLSILENIKYFSDFDVYGHIDYIIRYMPSIKQKISNASLSSFCYDNYKLLLDEVLNAIIYLGKGIEINSAGYKYGLGHANPHEYIIKRYFELGGTYITIGSDAHKPEHLAYAFSETRNMLLSLGIKEYAIFEQRKPIILPL